MRDLEQAAGLGIDTTRMVVVSHPDKHTRFGGGQATFTMTERAFVKRGLAARGFQIEGRAVADTTPQSLREQELEDEVQQLRDQLAAMEAASGDSADRRAELVAEAEALGVKVHPNAKDETIERKIAEARSVTDLDDGDEDFD